MFAVFGGIHDLRLKFPKPYSVSKAFSHSNGFRIDFMLLYVHADARATWHFSNVVLRRFSPGFRCEQDIFVRLVDSATKQVNWITKAAFHAVLKLT